MKKLIPAICMLLVAASLLGTSTYAWFSMNTSVSATGMKVTATTPSSLYIDTDSGMANKGFTKAATDVDTKSLLPTSTNMTNWWSAVAATSDNYQKTGSYSTVSEGDLAKYRRLDTFYVTAVNESDDFEHFGVTGINVTNGSTIASIDGGNDNLFKALKIAVVVTNTSDSTVLGTQHYAPRSAADVNNKYVTGADANADRVFIGTDNLTKTSSAIGTLSKNVVYKVEIYIYLDGEATECTSDNVNILNVQDVTVALTFGACSAT